VFDVQPRHFNELRLIASTSTSTTLPGTYRSLTACTTTTPSRLFSGTLHTTSNTGLTILQILFSTLEESQYNEMAATMLELDEI